jgi:polar amino acid transport system substrate-binding protein
MGLEKGCDLLQRLNITNVHPLLPPLEVAHLYLYMHKKHEALVPKVTDMLRTLKSDGTYEAIHQHLFTGSPHPKEVLSAPQP